MEGTFEDEFFRCEVCQEEDWGGDDIDSHAYFGDALYTSLIVPFLIGWAG